MAMTTRGGWERLLYSSARRHLSREGGIGSGGASSFARGNTDGLIAQLLEQKPDPHEQLQLLGDHGIPPTKALPVVHRFYPTVARTDTWQTALAEDEERVRRLTRALQTTATALLSRSGVALVPSALGDEWARDIDVLVAPEVEETVHRALIEAGFLELRPLTQRLGRSPKSISFGAVQGGEVLGVVDLIVERVERHDELGDIFSRSRPDAFGLPRLSPHDLLTRRSARISASRRVRLRDLLEMRRLLESLPGPDLRPDVAVAIRRCASLERMLVGHGPFCDAARGLPRSVRNLELWTRAKATRSAVSRRVSHTVRRHKSVVVGFSGVDGAGKSTQAELLASSLRRLGIPYRVEWSRLGSNGVLIDRLSPLRRRLSRSPEPTTRARARGAPVERVPTRRGLLGWTWTLIVVFDYVLTRRRLRQSRRGEVVIHDRTLLDAIVGVELGYGGSVDLRFHRWLLNALVPQSGLAFYLRLDGRTALTRKSDDFSSSVLDEYVSKYDAAVSQRVDVVTLDATRTAAETHHRVLTSLT